MIGLRTLGNVALIAGVFAGLVGCGDHKGDLGAVREDTPVVETVPASHEETKPTSAAPAGEVADLAPDKPVAPTTPAPAPTTSATDVKNAPAELVSLNPGNVADAAPVAVGKAIPQNGRETKGEGEQPPVAATAPIAPTDAAPAADGDKPAPAPTPPPAPVAETPEEKAARLLKEAERLSGVRVQANQQEADAAYQTGLKLFNDLEYEQAKQYFERAVTIDPTNEVARQKLQVVNSLLGIHVDKIAHKIRELEQGERVKQQESLVQLANAMQEGRILEERGTVLPPDAVGVDKDRILADQLESLRKAQDKFRRVKEILNWMPPSFDLPSERSAVDQSLVRLKQKIAEKEDEINYLRRVQAQKEADASRVRETELFKARIGKLLDQVKDLYERGDYTSAERLSIRILQIDPFNNDAESWKSKARAANHTKERADILDEKAHELKNMDEDIDQATIGYAPIILYPSNWDQITRRVDNLTLGKTTREEVWKSDILKKLQRKVTFDFVDTSLDEAVAFLRQVSGVTIIVDPKVMAANPANINLRVTDMSLDLALDWILRLANLEKVLKDHAIYISTPDRLQEAAELRIYDISDLTQSIPDFPGPELQLSTAGDPNQAAANNPAAGAFAPKATVVPTAASIADMIKTRVRPDSWDPALGTSVEEMAGRLVVMQRPEIHALIDQLLSSFRSTQRMMINIESRFLTIREAYLENIGVEYQGLDTNVLFGDFGDIRNLGTPNGLLQPRRPGASDATPANVPFPGIVAGPQGIGGGTFSTVGSIVNHRINYATNDNTTISSEDSTGTIRQGGLNAQLTVINNTQLQAFIRALAVRESQSTLIAPRLTVFNTQRAHMFVARQQSYVSDYDINGDSYDPVVRQFLEGVVLDVRPIVSADRRYVTVEMRPTVTQLVNFVTRQLDSFTVNSGAQVNLILRLSFPIQFPELSISRVRTTATVPDGGILLLGGLYRNIKFKSENGVPFISDLPVVGRLFRWNVAETAKQNLSILLSPRIILFSEEEEKL